MKPTLGRIVHVKPGEHSAFPPNEWHAALVVCDPFPDVIAGECFSVQVFSRTAVGFTFQSHSVDAEGRTWRWPPREPS